MNDPISPLFIEDQSQIDLKAPTLDMMQWWPEPQQLVQLSQQAVPSEGLRANPTQLGELGAPWLDLVCTSFSARATILAANTGRAFYAHELRGRLPMPSALEPEVDVWAHGTTPVWDDGVLNEPKYFSFFQDAPFAAFNPNHRRKWRAHELLHGVMGFFWHPQMSRFEFYLGARLNELIPVVHWYGLDEMFRARCDVHQGARLLRTHCVACEQAARPFWEVDRQDDHLNALALKFATLATAHIQQEWAACMEELQTGQPVATHWHGLNASSDAIGYLQGHWPRCTAWSFGAWMEQFMVDGLDYCASLEGYAARIADRLGALLGGALHLDWAAHRRLRQRRVLQDVAYRTYLALEWLDPARAATDAMESACGEVLDAMALCAQSLLAGSDESIGQADELVDALYGVISKWSSYWPVEIFEPFFATGYRWTHAQPQWAIDSIVEGVHGAFPMTVEQTSWRCDEAQARALIESPGFDALGCLRDRFWAECAPEQTSDVRSWQHFEQWAGALPRVDEQGEHFAVIPPDAQALVQSRWRLNATWRVADFDRQFVQDQLGLDLGDVDGAQVRLLGVLFRGSLRLVVVDALVEMLLRFNANALDDEDALMVLTQHWEMVESLFMDGVLIWTGYLS